MAVKRLVPLTKINGASAGSTATINCDTGALNYHSITLGYKTGTAGGATEATMESEVTEIRLLLDGVVQRRFSPAQLFDMNRIKGVSPTVSASTAIPGYMTMFFSEPQRQTQQERELTAWGTDGVGTFQIEIDIASGAGVTALTGFAIVDDQSLPPVGIVKWKREIIQVAATGELNYVLDTQRGDAYQSVTFIEATAGDIGALELTWDGLQIYKDDENFAAELLNFTDFTAVSKHRHVPLSFNSLSDAVRSVKQDPKTGQIRKVGTFNAKLTMDAAANVTCIRELLGSPD